MSRPSRRTALLALLLAAAAAPGAARADAVDDTLARIEAARARVRTLAADFEQERVMGLFGQSLRAQGRLLVQRPGNIRWEITAPTPAVFVVAGGRVAYRAGRSSASATQQQVGPLGAVLGDLAAFLGAPLGPLRARYRLAVAGGAAGAGVTLMAVPLDPAVARVVSRIVLRFRPDLAALEGIDLEEPGGDHTRVLLRNVRLNAPLPAGAFAP